MARTGARVLLVEDEPGLLRALLINLRARQYNVLTASSGADALATAVSRTPDAVILDLGLPGGTTVAVGHCVIDLTAHTVARHPDQDPGADTDTESDTESEPVRLTPTEWRILESLAQRPGQRVSARQLLAEIWGPDYEPRTNYLRFHLARLRRKLEDDPARPRHLLTEPGTGYRYRP